MNTKSKKFDNDHVSYELTVDQQKSLATTNTAKPYAKTLRCNDLSGSQSCENNVLYAKDGTLVRNINKAPRESTSPSSQNDTKAVKHSLKDQDQMNETGVEDTYSESVNSNDSNTFKKVPSESENASVICERNITKCVQFGNKNIMCISNHPKSTHCQQIGNKNIIVHVQVNSKRFKQTGIEDRDSEDEGWSNMKRRILDLIGIDTESNDSYDVLDDLKDDLLNSDSNKNITLDCSSLFHEGDSHSTQLKYLKAEEEDHYAANDIVERKDSLRITFGKKNNQSMVLGKDNLAELPIRSLEKVLDFLVDNGNDFDVTVTDCENDSEYDFIPSFAVESDQLDDGSFWLNHQHTSQCSDHPSENKNQIPPVPKRKARRGAIRRVSKGDDGENKRRREQSLPPKYHEEISPERLRSVESQSANEYEPVSMLAKRSRLSENDAQISQPSRDNITGNGSTYPDTNKWNNYDNVSSLDSNGKTSGADSVASTKKCKPVIASKPKNLHQKGQQTDSVTIKPPIDQQGLAINTSHMSTEVNSQKMEREKEMEDSVPTMIQDGEPELVEDSCDVESQMKSKKLLDLIKCYSNVKEFKREEYMTDDTCFEALMDERPSGTFLVRPGISTKLQVLVVKTSNGSLHKFKIHEKYGLFYLVENDMLQSIDELVQYYSFVTLPSDNFRSVLERGIYSKWNPTTRPCWRSQPEKPMRLIE